MMPKIDPLRFIADHAGLSLADAILEAYRQGQQDAQPEIVQCKDCKYWDSTGYCLYGSRLAWRGNYNDYCSRAKRREG